MSKNKESDDSVQLNSADRDGLDKASGSPTEQELFKDFDEKRRSFLMKCILISANLCKNYKWTMDCCP